MLLSDDLNSIEQMTEDPHDKSNRRLRQHLEGIHNDRNRPQPTNQKDRSRPHLKHIAHDEKQTRRHHDKRECQKVGCRQDCPSSRRVGSVLQVGFQWNVKQPSTEP